MKTIKKVPVIPEFFPGSIPEKPSMKQGVIYISEEFHTAIHLCLCGCGNEVVTPLAENEWILTRNGEKITLSPSIGNYQFPCKSHYIITNNVANFV